MPSKKERRQYGRYDTEMKIYFRVAYDIETKVKYQELKFKAPSRKYSAISKNISVEGLCFTSRRELERGTLLHLEVYLPKDDQPVEMTGEVRWSLPIEKSDKFTTGIKLLFVDGKDVADSIYFDENYKVFWSEALERVLGSFRIMAQEGKLKNNDAA